MLKLNDRVFEIELVRLKLSSRCFSEFCFSFRFSDLSLVKLVIIMN